MTIKQQGGIFGRNPTFNNLTADGYAVFGGDASFLNTSGSVKGFWNSTTSRFGLGTISPLGILQLREGNPDLYITSDDTGQTDIFFGGASAPTTGNIKYSDNNKSLRLTANSTEALRLESTGNVNVKTGNLVIGTSGKGIDFSATSGTGTSELFDDYEEGTWTPAFTPTGTDFSSITYDTQSGHYTKVGRLVTVTGFIRTDAITVGSASGSVLISGLPYAATSAAVGSVGGTYNWGGDVPLSVTIFNTSTELYMYYRTSVNGIDSAIAPSDMGTGANNNDIYFTISYMAS